ncbi:MULTISPECIES: flagellar hook-associated protein FlgK [Paenibacillus]|uniref:flagellar hook-associated protein FlgK n=1 Tax=Paenibacillus TaxID=44249 RepID=UPI000385B367|nr:MULTISPECIES: flagellar hook-associated protein FlgK [Paenibacillus]EPY09499.1 flagellar hook-associated protein FlgK [Paenibacillus alvei A6-6i-x]SDG23742.1 flagellar hook-associated protein 1 FlgK [Paenibacillus sp. cl6col]
MRSTFHGIETAKRSLFAHTAWMNTTGHNIANANTPGYSRQVVNLVESRPIEAPGFSRSGVPGQLGTGVEFNYIKRIRERFLDDQYWNANRSLGEWEIQADTLTKLEKVFNEPSDSSIRMVMDNFWKSWSELSKDPENVTSRKIVRENALALIDAFNETSKKMTDMQNDLSQSVTVKADHINTLSKQVSQLNYEIYRIEGLGDNANDLRDQRDYIVDELSKLANVQVSDQEDGYYITAGGIEIVSGRQSLDTTAADWEGAYGNGLTSGEMFGIVKSRDVLVKDYLEQLNQLANTLATGEVEITIPSGSVIPDGTTLGNITYNGAIADRTLKNDITVKVKGLNGLHQLGYVFGTPATKGVEFFTSKNGGPITASSIQLNPAILKDPNLIASSLRTITGKNGDEVVKGNNTLALLMSQLKESSFKFNAISSNNGITQGTVDDYYRSILGQMGVESLEAIRQTENNQILVDQIESRRQSVSGVSMDEEMSNLIKFQHAYAAAARFMTTLDQNLDKVINGMGVVGR